VTDPTASLRAALADGYRIERELGQGGMVTVYLAEDLKHRRRVAVKVLRPELAVALGADRFLREIETTAGLRHPHILPLYDSGEAGGFLFYVMPLVEGESLRDRLVRQKQLPVDEALRIAREVADALGYAHARGVVHRDIKPENILLEGGHAVVADFGIARAVSGAAGRLTQTGMSIGTPLYMSPEQAAGDPEVDGRSDLYSLGCVLYEMLGGQPPFTGPTAEAITRQHMITEAAPVTNLRPTVVPGPPEMLAAESGDLMVVGPDAGAPLHLLQLGQHAEELELVGVPDSAVVMPRLDFGQQLVDRVGVGHQLADPLVPGPERPVVVRQPIEGLLQLDRPEQPQLVEMLLRIGPFEVDQGRGALAPIVEEIGEVDPRLGEGGVDRQGPPEPEDRRSLAAQPMRDVSHAGRRLLAFRLRTRRQLEESVGMGEEPLAEQRPTDLEHQVVVLLKSELEGPVESFDRPLLVADSRQRLTEPGESVLMVWLQHQGPGEGRPSPEEILPGQVGAPHPDVQLDRGRISGQPLSQRLERLVVTTLVV